MMPTLSSLVAPEVGVMVTYDSVSSDRVGVMTALSPQDYVLLMETENTLKRVDPERPCEAYLH